MSLAGEMRAAADAITLPQCQRLSVMGITSWPDLTQHGLIGVAACKISGDFFNYDEGGPLHVVLPVERDGVLVDLVAFDPANPNLWGLRTGDGAALGDCRIEEALSARGWPDAVPLYLTPTPLEWLRAQCRGACIIDGFTPETCTRLRGLDDIAVSSKAFERALRLQLSKPPRIPEIHLAEGRRNAA